MPWINRLRQVAEEKNFNIFLDPDNGIRLEGRRDRDPRKFVWTQEIEGLLRIKSDTLLLCFDQSLCRGSEIDDRSEKLEDLGKRGIYAQYYFCSDASILIASGSYELLRSWGIEAIALGIPAGRFQLPDPPPPELPE